MKPEKMLSRHSLANGLTLELWDHSRPVAGDRWYLALEARITIPVQEPNLPPELIPQVVAVAAALGAAVVFSHQDERNFIAASEAPRILQEMQTRALDLAAGYFGHPDFARRVLRQKYAAYLEKQQS